MLNSKQSSELKIQESILKTEEIRSSFGYADTLLHVSSNQALNYQHLFVVLLFLLYRFKIDRNFLIYTSVGCGERKNQRKNVNTSKIVRHTNQYSFCYLDMQLRQFIKIIILISVDVLIL